MMARAMNKGQWECVSLIDQDYDNERDVFSLVRKSGKTSPRRVDEYGRNQIAKTEDGYGEFDFA